MLSTPMKTSIWCSNCQSIQPCKALPPHTIDSSYKSTNRRYYRTNHPDIRYFARGRECMGCGFQFVTSEINNSHIDELVQLRKEVAHLKKEFGDWIKKEKDYTENLENLRNLSVSLVEGFVAKVLEATNRCQNCGGIFELYKFRLPNQTQKDSEVIFKCVHCDEKFTLRCPPPVEEDSKAIESKEESVAGKFLGKCKACNGNFIFYELRSIDDDSREVIFECGNCKEKIRFITIFLPLLTDAKIDGEGCFL